MANRKPHILIIYTGGTIGMLENPITHSLEPFDFTHLIDNVPKIKMMYLFGLGLPPQDVRQYLSRTLCGEMTI